MIRNIQSSQHTAVSLARKLPLTAQEVAHLAAYSRALPPVQRLRGTTLPVADFLRSGIAPAPAALMSVGAGNAVVNVSGSVPRGRPV
jgi:hypothetical protein